ncbi:hypothetical protein RI129_002929 [Pyrocoelia pectoralis]|uniref:SAM domain-containing protein n=1 Tax=Pyrocoelia pectoralis TaxID=417401 RepID=A0AAN7ZMM4_9COLE
MDVKELLTTWGCTEDVINTFVEQDICLEVLKDLSLQDITQLVPTLGMRKLLHKKISEMKNENKENEINYNESSNTTSTSTITIENSNSELNIIDINQSSVMDIDISDLFTEIRSFPDFDLDTLLQTSPMGNSILKYYQTEKVLDNKRRNRLVDIIMKHLYTYIIKNRLRHEEYNKISAKIITLFPTEIMGIYYVPPIKKQYSTTGKSIVARGKLVDKLKNIIYTCEDATPKRTKRKGVLTDTESDEINTNEDFLWLTLYTDPWSEVISRWEKTYELRRTNAESYSTVNEFINVWPILRDQRCETLINWDFAKLYPHKDINLFCKWKFFFDTVKTLRKYTDDVLQEEEHEDNEDILFLKQLIQLPSLLPPKGRTVKDKKHWKYSTLEVTDSIVVLAKTPGDICEVLEKQNKLCAVRGITLQPFIIVEGTSFDKPNNFYVVLDNVFLRLDRAQKTFDTLFKIFHVLNVKYPLQSAYIYTLIQNCVYGISLECDNLPPHTLDILHKVQTTRVLVET